MHNKRLRIRRVSVQGSNDLVRLSAGFTSVDFLAYQAHNTRGIDNPAPVTACMGLLAQELATGIFAAKKDASTVYVPVQE